MIYSARKPPTTWDRDTVDKIMAEGRDGKSFNKIGADMNLCYESVRRKWYTTSTPDDRKIRAVAVKNTVRAFRQNHIEKRSVMKREIALTNDFIDDPRAVARDYGRTPLQHETWIPYRTS